MKKILSIIIFSVPSLICCSQNTDYKKLTDEGLEMLTQENIPLAFEKYKQALKIDSTKIEAIYGIGVVYVYKCVKGNQKEYSSNALYYLNKAIKINDSYRYCYYQLGTIKAYLSEYNSALKDFNTALQKDSTDADSFFSRAMVKTQLKDHKGACEDLYKSFRLGSKEAYETFQHNCAAKK